MLYLRSALFNLAFYTETAIILILGIPLFLLPRKYLRWATRQWSRLSIWLVGVIAGTKYELRGIEHLPHGPAFLAAKHQSMWDTLALAAFLDDPAVVLKRELMHLPLYGWYAKKARMIAVDRGAHSKAVRDMLARAEQVIADGRQIVIFPQGTRVAPGTTHEYKPGSAALYRRLGLPCVPVAVNSGLFWPRRKFLHHPGTIIMEFLEPIEAGLNRREFMTELERRIETASNRLLAEADLPGPPPISSRPVDNLSTLL